MHRKNVFQTILQYKKFDSLVQINISVFEIIFVQKQNIWEEYYCLRFLCLWFLFLLKENYVSVWLTHKPTNRESLYS